MSNLSAALTAFFDAEIRNEETMRRENGYPGTKEYEATLDASSDTYIPQSALGTALDSWEQAPQDVRADLCGGASEHDVLIADEDLRSMVAVRGADYPLIDLLR